MKSITSKHSYICETQQQFSICILKFIREETVYVMQKGIWSPFLIENIINFALVQVHHDEMLALIIITASYVSHLHVYGVI